MPEQIKSDKPKEECGIFGINGHENASNLTYLGLYSLQHRGQESAGIASSDGEYIYRYAGQGKVTEVFRQEENITNLRGHMAIGHNRYSTTGSSLFRNVQPLRADTILGPIILCHNGNLVNTAYLRNSLEKEGAIFQSSIDSEVVIHLMARSGINDFLEALTFAIKQIKGSYSMMVMNKKALYAVRDPNGFKPLVLGKLDSAYVVASETCAFDIIDAEYVRDIEPGELVEITEDGIKSYYPFPQEKHAYCIFEYIYFANPSSRIYNNSVYDVRMSLGRMLYKQSPVEADIVVPIPDSANVAALGFSRESGIPYEIGLIRNHYIGRTFIEPEQKIRDFGAKIKYNVVKSAIKGKRVVIVDDSIIRGTTQKKIVNMFKKAGAKEIHVRISAPYTKFPCYYGIDIPTHNELIASNYSVEEIRKFLEVDSLVYLTIPKMIEAIGRPEMNFCMACFSGDYPVKFEHSEENQKFLFEDATIGKYY